MNKNFKFIRTIAIIIILSIIFSSCQLIRDTNATENGEYRVTNINIYRDTPAWELALAVKGQNTKKIERIAKENPELLNYQDPKYDATLLLWAVGMEKYKSAEALLKAGADPNIASTVLAGETPLFRAAGFSWIDNVAKKDPKYVKLLLSYGADPNKNYIGSEYGIEPGTSPLMNSIGCGIEKTKALVEAGADINHKLEKSHETAADKALLAGWNSTLEGLEYAYYLIVEKKAKVTDPTYRRKNYANDDPNDKFYPVGTLRYWVYDLDSKEYEIKMEIVKEFERQGVNYWDTDIPKSTLEHIKVLYPNTWEEYIKKY